MRAVSFSACLRLAMAGALALGLVHAVPGATQPAAAPTPESDYEGWERALEARLNREMDALIDAGRTGDEARIAALMVAADAETSGPRMHDYRASGADRLALTREALRDFATRCRRSREQQEFFLTVAYSLSVQYECGGDPGYSIYAFWNEEGDRIESLSVYGPESSRELSPAEITVNQAAVAAENAVYEAEREAEEARFRATVDALFAAAAAGDQARFAALLGRGHEGRGTAFRDDRNEIIGVPITIEAVRPLAAACRRADEPSQLMSGMEPTDMSQTAWFLCDGRRTYIEAGFEENGAKIHFLIVEGEVRRQDPRLR